MRQYTEMIVVAAMGCVVACQSMAGGVKYQNDDGHYVKLGGRIQLQYHMMDLDGGESTDELLFRRLRPYIEGSVHEDWLGKFQFDLGKSKVEVKDAYAEYKGLDFATISFGNKNFPFSRELLTSSKKQQLVERTFVGEHDYGTPERQAGIHLEGDLLDGHLGWAASVAKGAVDPDNKKLDFDTTISLNKGDDWSEGNMIGGRIDFHPFGHLKFEQGDFKRDLKATISVAGFGWQNDDDNLDSAREDDVDNVVGLEISGALRVAGVSIDAQYNQFESDLVDAGITSGLYVDSSTTLKNYAVEGGVMVLPGKVELVAGYQSQDADGYAETWDRTSVGVNLFQKKQDIKYQITYQMGANKDGKAGNDVDELFVQAQYVF
ncbi:MAG: hypothetical protein HQ523_07445 [Lentisphaerae bacterium]|nr:hypothetical protein [Lentisphaerota bacterium]